MAEASVEACARCAAENASLTQISPTCSSATNAGSCFLLLMEACIFQTKDVALLHCRHRFLRDLADASSAKATGLLMTSTSAAARASAIPWGRALGPAEMRQRILAALAGYLDDGGRHALEPGGIGTRPFSSARESTRTARAALHVERHRGAECFGLADSCPGARSASGALQNRTHVCGSRLSGAA